MRNIALIVCVLTAVVCPAPAQIYVDASATGNDDGTSWTDAYTELTNAIANCGDGVEIRVATASYSPGGADGDSFYLTNNIISGGYPAGGGTRDPAANETIMEGDYGGGNNYHVVEKTGNSTLILDGLIIQNGTADGSNPDDDGAGIYMTGGNIILSNCVVRNNYANDWAGGIWVDGANTPSPRFVNCTFEDNSAPAAAGAIFFESGVGSPVISNCTFSGNDTVNVNTDGGAIYGAAGGTLSIYDTVFTNNSAYRHGGAIYLSGGAGGLRLVADSTSFINNNTRAGAGGAAYISSRNNGPIIIDGGTVTGNDSGAYGGGAFYIIDSDGFQIKNITFPEHTATNGNGGHLWLDIITSGCTGLIANCTFTDGSSANSGGSIFIADGHDDAIYTITNCTFSGNDVLNANQDGGAIYFQGDAAALNLYDVVFTNNSAYRYGGALCLAGASLGPPLVADSTVSFINNNTRAGQGGAAYVTSRDNGLTVLDGCTVVGNDCGSGGGGAFCIIDSSGFEIKNITFGEHTATNSNGGHLYLGIETAGSTGLIANCTFTDGASGNSGGSIYIVDDRDDAIYTITNCTFSDNDTLNNNSDGGAIYVAGDAAALNLYDVVFTNNSAVRWGGALCLAGASLGPPLVADSTVSFINNNTRVGQGGAAYVTSRDNGLTVLDGCTVVGNDCGSGGGGAFCIVDSSGFEIKNITFGEHTATNSNGGHLWLDILTSGCTGLIANCSFTDGNSGYLGGSIYIESGVADAIYTITNCTFSGNETLNVNSDGGAIYGLDGALLKIVDCVFTNHYAVRWGGLICLNGTAGGMALNLINSQIYDASANSICGGLYLNSYNNGDHVISNCTFRNISGVGVGGAMYLEGGGSTHIYNTDFSKCESTTQGGAIYVGQGASQTANVFNCTFHTNVSSSGGGAIYLSEGDLNITNTIFYGNNAGGTGDEIYGDGGDTLNIGYCNIDSSKIENIGTVNSANLINTNPLFYSESTGDYHLQSQFGRWNGTRFVFTDTIRSPCVDAGDPSWPYDNEVEDNGNTNNIGRYGNTAEASRSAFLPLEVDNFEVQNLTSNSVDFVGQLLSSNATATVYIFYGTSNEGSNFTWQAAATNIAPPIGFFTNTVSVTPDRVYYWRCYATNAFRDHWSMNTDKFMTGPLIVEAPDPTASEFGPDTGTFTIHRPTDCTNGPWTVSYTMSGTANNGLDYTTLSGSATFAEGETNISLTVTPIIDLELGETNETVILNLTDADNHLLASPSNNTVIITNNPLYNVVYVDKDAVGDNNGTTWAHAYTSLTNALGSQSDAMAFWIAEGTYTPGGASAQYFNIGSKDLYGGFVGTETNLNERNWTNNQTILETDTTDQRIIHKSTDGTAILDGLIIKDGDETGNGGALECTDGTMLIRNCTFTNNICTGNGGSLYLNSSKETHTISNTLFTGSSTAVDYGGAIYLAQGDIEVWNSTFSNNTVSLDGGAIWIDGIDKPTPIFNGCTFINNTAPNREGGVLFIENNAQSDWGTFLFQGCTFDSNSAGNADGEGGGCIYAMDGEIIIKIVDCLFTNNSANQEGAVLFIEGAQWAGGFEMYNSQFYNNSATDGGVVWQSSYDYNIRGIVSNCWFENNTASSEGGAFYLEQTEGLTIMDSVFMTNQATGDGGHAWINLRSGKSCTIINSHFTNGVSTTEDGGAIFMQDSGDDITLSTYMISNCTFNGNVAGNGDGDTGGAIHGTDGSTVKIYDTLFTNNTAKGDGGAISMEGAQWGNPLQAYNVDFFYNTSGSDGGAIYNNTYDKGSMIIHDCTFESNSITGTANGGTLCIQDAGGFEIKNSTFPKSSAGNGGHIYMATRSGTTGIIDNCTFENGSASHDGGSIYILDTGDASVECTYIITNSTFKSCTSGTDGSGSGGSIAGSDAGTLFVQNCLFTNSVADDNGGAIWLNGGEWGLTLHLQSSEFYNSTGVVGGAVYINSREYGIHVISNNTFRSSTATGQGGGIYVNEADGIEFYNNTFSYCESSGNQGGAIWLNPGDSDAIPIVNCTFHTNTASSGGGAIYLAAGLMSITNSIFYENHSGSQADTIYGNGGDTLSLAYCNVDTNTTSINNIGTISYGDGIINTNPLFVSAVSNDYHLKSEWGHYVNATSWVNDAETSQCVLQGQPNADYAREPHHNGRRNNMGRYGNTPEASKHLYLWVENIGVSQLQDTSATLNGELEATNGIPTTVYTFYGTVNAGTNKTWQNEVRNAGALEGAFSNNVSSLTASTKYYWRCYATNAIEEHWSTNVMEIFTTGSPVVTNGPATALTFSSARISGGLEAGGYADAWICWGTNDGGTISTSYWDNVVPMGTATQDVGFATTASGLEENKTYWFRCYVSNAGGSDWSDNPTPFAPVPQGLPAAHQLLITFTNFAGRGTLTNFPALIKLTTNNTDNYTGFLDTTNGYDLRFWDYDLTTELKYEIEKWDPGIAAIASDPFSPTNVSGCVLWLDAGQGVTTNASGNITEWTDLSGSGNHATNAVGYGEPDLVLSAINGRPAASFDGTHRLVFSGADAKTVFFVCTADSASEDKDGILGQTNAVGVLLGIRRYGNTGWRKDGDIAEFTLPAGSEFYVNGSDTTTAAENMWHMCEVYRNDNAATFHAVGGGGNDGDFHGDIAEVIIYNGALSAEDSQSINLYLAAKYDLDTIYGNSEAHIWVKIPELTNNLSIWATWGDEAYNSQATYTTNGDVWSEGFGGVWHLKDDVKDSTSNDNDGTKQDSALTRGMIGNCQLFDGTSDDIDCGNDTSLHDTNTITISVWMRPSNPNGWSAALSRGADQEYELEFPDSSNIRMNIDNNEGDPGTSIDQDTWYYVVGTYGDESKVMKFYKDGILQASASNKGPIVDLGNDVWIGSRGGGNEYKGKIDEARMSTVARGSNWIWACYMNQGTNHSSFQTYGVVVPPTNAIQNLAPTYVTQTSATFNATLFCPENGFDVFVHWSQTNHSTNFTWNNSANVGGWTNAAQTNISYKAVNLETGTQYYYTFRITNATTNIWAEPIWDFLSASPDVVLVKPEVNNTAGPSGISGSGATLNGNVSSTGGEDPTVTVYWGDNDGKTTAGNWDTNINMGTLGAGTFSTNVTTASSNKTYYYRTAAANSAGTTWASETKAWLVKPIPKADWHLVSSPVHWGAAASNNLNAALGNQLATGLDSGTGPGDSDNLWLQINGSWVQYWLDTGNVWKSNATAANITIEPGEGFWIKRLTASADDAMIFEGNAQTNSVEITFNNSAWTVFSWPYGPQGQANWGFDDAVSGFAWESSDNIIGEYNGSWFAIYYRDGTWCKRGTSDVTPVQFEAGRAYYYYHRGGSPMQWTAPNN